MTNRVAPSSPTTRKWLYLFLFAVYLTGAIPSAWYIIAHTTASTNAIEQILINYNMKNEGSLAIDRYAKEHPFVGMLFSSPIKHEMELPSHEESSAALGSEMAQYLKTVRMEASKAAWWSWFLLNFSLLYVVVVIALHRSFFARASIFSLAIVSIFLFVIGVLAPAMVIWTAPTIPMASGNLSFVLQHQVRGIAAIIKELITTGHWIIGGFLLLFSIVTPLTKICLTLFATESHNKTLNLRIGQILHAIGKWSMADVFVAGVLLSIYALKAQEATKSIPCLGIYYFIGYCLLSMSTTVLLVHSGIVEGNDVEKAERPFGRVTMSILGAVFAGFLVASSLYTYQQYTMNTKQHVTASDTPQTLNNADLVLPAHK